MSALSLPAAASEAGDALALVIDDREVTYRDLEVRARQATRWLIAQGIDPARSEPLALVMRPELATVELFWAVFGLGRPLLLLAARSTTEARQALVGRAGASLLDADAWVSAAPRLPRASRLSTSELAANSPEAQVIVPTSGTSGRPKLVVLSERALAASARAHFANCRLEPEDRWLACLPLAHVGGLSILTRMLFARKAAVLFSPPGPLLSHLDALTLALERTRSTFVSLVPTLLAELLAQGFRATPQLRAVLLGGAAPSRALLERASRAHLPVLPSYGLTETCSQVVARPYARRFDPPRGERALPSSGVPLPPNEVRVAPDGTLEIRGPTLLDRYFDEPTPFTEDGYFRSADRGVFDADGELVVLGRNDDVVVTGGEKVDPNAVEAVLLELPWVRAACVFAEPDERWGNLVAAAIVPSERPFPTSQLQDACARKLASHERPRAIALLDELPLTPTGKVDRAEVRERARGKLVRAP